MNPGRLGPLLAAVIATAVPFAALHLTAPEDRLDAGLTAAPFAWPRLLAAHLIAALPLAYVIARTARTTGPMRDSPAWPWLLAGVALLALAAGPLTAVAESLWESGAGPTVMLLVRSGTAVALVLPWLVAILRPGDCDGPLTHPKALLALGVSFALVPCGLYAEGVVAARTSQVEELLGRERLVKARRITDGLAELGSDVPILGRELGEVRKALAGRIVTLERVARRPSSSAPPQDRLQMALVMIQLDRLGTARSLLESLPGTDPTVSLLLATVRQEQEHWAESDALFESVLAEHLTRAAEDEQARSLSMTALEALAFNARNAGRAREVGDIWRRGLDAIPAEAAHFHFELARHYADSGRHRLALESLDRAVAADPERFGPKGAEMRQRLQTETPACVMPGRSE